MTIKTILRIDSSAQLEDRSLTRQLTSVFIEAFVKNSSDTKVIVRDLGTTPPPAIDHEFIHAAFTPENEREEWMVNRLQLSDKFIDEIECSDLIVMGAPMYNYGMPSALKAWIDHIARIGRTFSFDLERGDFPIEPILSGKKLIVLSSRGEFDFGVGGLRANLNALDPAIAACSHYLGVERQEIETIAIEYQEFKDERHKISKSKAIERTYASAIKWSEF